MYMQYSVMLAVVETPLRVWEMNWLTGATVVGPPGLSLESGPSIAIPPWTHTCCVCVCVCVCAHGHRDFFIPTAALLCSLVY